MFCEDDALLANPEIVFREEEDGAFLFDPDTGELKCLNSMGGVIWRLCDGTRTMQDLLREMTGQYPAVATDRLRKDLVEFLHELFEIGYLGNEMDGAGGN